MANEIVHWEFMGPDGAAITSFYENLFGWKSEGVARAPRLCRPT
jgi:predicted enzyme related to lactoylglutathione lyase